MAGQEEKPIIYTMENKPIVTCECLLNGDVHSFIFYGLDS